MNDPGEEWVVCPYNKAHAELKSRMAFHLTKCRMNYKNLETAMCPFNSTHIVNKVELDNHKDACPDRGVVDNFIYRMSDSPAPSGLLPVQTFPIYSNDEEGWDDPPASQTNVLQQLAAQVQTKRVLIPKIGAPKSERKNHRFNERLRYNALKSESETNSRQAASAPAPVLDGTASHTPRAPPSSQEQKKVEISPSPHMVEPKFIHPQSSGSLRAAVPLSNAWSGGRPAPQVGNRHEFPTLGSKATRRDNDVGLQDQMNNMTLLDSDRNERPNVWGKPAPRQQDARIAVPAYGLGGGSNRSHMNPWNKSSQQSRQQPAQPMPATAAPPEASQLGPMPASTSDDFPVLGCGRKFRN